MVVFVHEGTYAKVKDPNKDFSTVVLGLVASASMVALMGGILSIPFETDLLSTESKIAIIEYSAIAALISGLWFRQRFEYRRYTATKYRNGTDYEDKETGEPLDEKRDGILIY